MQQEIHKIVTSTLTLTLLLTLYGPTTVKI